MVPTLLVMRTASQALARPIRPEPCSWAATCAFRTWRGTWSIGARRAASRARRCSSRLGSVDSCCVCIVTSCRWLLVMCPSRPGRDRGGPRPLLSSWPSLSPWPPGTAIVPKCYDRASVAQGTSGPTGRCPGPAGYTDKRSRMMNEEYDVKGTNRDQRRDRERMKQVVHPPLLYRGHRAGRKADERRLAQAIKKARKKG